MKHRLFTILSALLLVLCLACLLVWVRGRHTQDTIDKNYDNGRHIWRLNSIDCSVQLELFTFTNSPYPPQPLTWHSSDMRRWSLPPTWKWTWPHFTYNRFNRFDLGTGSYQMVVLPYWLLTLLFGLLPSLWVRSWLHRWKAKRRQKAGLCRVCGYDLRASPERCPECGTAVPSPATSPASPPAPSPSDPA